MTAHRDHPTPNSTREYRHLIRFLNRVRRLKRLVVSGEHLIRGLLGLAAEARERRSCCPDADQGQRAFYDAVETVCQAAIVLSHRFAEQAEAMASAHPEHQR